MQVLEYSFKQHKIKQVILSLEPGWFHNNTNRSDYAYLYDTSRINDFKAYIDELFIICLFYHKACLKGQEDIDRPANWIHEPSTKIRLGGFNSWLATSNRPDIKDILKKINDYKNMEKKIPKQFFPEYLVAIFKKNPNTFFYLVLPPFSTLNYKISPIFIDDIIKNILKLNLPNIKIYGFDNTNIPSDLSHYIDLIHYDEKVNSFMLDAIKNDTHRIALENIDTYFEEMRRKVEAYDIEPLRKQIIESGVLDK